MRFLRLLLALLVTAPAFALDHTYADYAAVLQRFVADGKVDYAGLKTDRSGLDHFLNEAASVPFSDFQAFTKPQKMAFVINLYNAAAIALVLNHFPVASVNEIGGVFSSPWNMKFVKLFEHDVGLGHIEHDIVRPEFKDPRTHFALVNATSGGASLRSDPYLPERLDEQLQLQTDTFMNSRPEVNRFENGQLHLSPIFDWYADDWGGKRGVLEFAHSYFPQADPKTKIKYSNYDWSLNSK